MLSFLDFAPIFGVFCKKTLTLKINSDQSVPKASVWFKKFDIEACAVQKM